MRQRRGSREASEALAKDIWRPRIERHFVRHRSTNIDSAMASTTTDPYQPSISSSGANTSEPVVIAARVSGTLVIAGSGSRVMGSGGTGGWYASGQVAPPNTTIWSGVQDKSPFCVRTCQRFLGLRSRHIHEGYSMVEYHLTRERRAKFRNPLIGATFVLVMMMSTLSVYAAAQRIMTTASQYNAAISLCRTRGGTGLLVPLDVSKPQGPHVVVVCHDASGRRV